MADAARSLGRVAGTGGGYRYFAGGVFQALDGGGGEALRDEGGDVEVRFGGVEVGGAGEERGAARQKHGAAIVERLGGNIVRADFASGVENFEFVGADQRTKHGHARGSVHGDEVAQRLRGDLGQAVSGDERERAFAFREHLRDAQHHPAIEQNAKFLRRVAHDLALDGFEGNAVELQVELVADELPREAAGDVQRRFAGARARP